MELPAKIKNYVGKTVFIVGYDGDCETGNIDAFETLEYLNAYLSQLSPISEVNLTVVHGILVPAEYIPEDIGLGVYLVVTDPEEVGDGCIFEVSSGEQRSLTDLIEETLEGYKDGLPKVTIDDLFVLYGYEMSMCYAVNKDQVDEEMLECSQKVADVANKMRENILDTEV